MLLALLEWFLWLGAFMYCLIKVYQKAEHWSARILSVIVAFIFTALRHVNWIIIKDFLLRFCIQTYLPTYHARYVATT